jgi:RHS repeat-associated protein
MSKQIKAWGWPAVAFLAAGILAILAGPSMGSMLRLRVLQGATDFCARCGDEFQGPSGGTQTGQSPASFQASGAPVQYAKGQNLLGITEFEVTGPRGWIHRRATWGLNGSETLAGPGWKVTGLLQLISEGTGTMSVVNGSTSVRTFQDNGNGTFTALNWYKDTLVVLSGDFYRFTDANGNQWLFRGFNSSFTPPSLFGKFYSSTDTYGNTTSTVYGTSGVTDGRILEIDQFPAGDPNNGTRILYNYNLSGVAAGYLSSVVYQRVVSAAGTTVRQSNYTYYLSTGSNGAAGQLQRSQVTDGSNVLDTYYHRYSTASGSPARLILGPVGYERAKASLGSDAAIDSATDATLGTWADYTFGYNGFFPSGSSVSSETVQGTGCSCGTGGGTGTFSFTYTNAGHGLHGVNIWNQKTIETLPDGNQNIVYTDDAGATLLDIFKNVSTGQQWMTYHQYDSARREILTAMPSAVISYDENQASLGVSLQASSGLFYLYGFYSITDLGTGSVAGYRSTVSVRQGTGGSAVLLSQVKYTSHTDGSGVTIYPVASSIQYRNTDGTGAITTSFSHSFHGTTNQTSERRTTFPTVLTTQNGSGSSTTFREQYDILGRVIWRMDQDGFIQYVEYDPTTSGVTKLIRDVNTSLVTNEPVGWVTPGGGGLHLVTQFELDSLGRALKVTDPLGLVSYSVYKDSAHETRIYPGWDATNHVPTGPTQVSRDDRTGGYAETLTMSAAPTFDGTGRPTGAEAVSSLQSLSRTYFDTGGRVAYSDSYFNFSGLTYSTAINIGTQGTHFYRASLGYDARGRVDRSVTWDGTITRTVYDSRSRVSSSWVGTDDSPTSGDWSPTNTAGTNLIKTFETEYDSNGVGDSTVTRSRRFTSAVNSLDTTYQYDFRDRPTDARGSNIVATRVTYDNLDRAVTTEVYYDGDLNFVLGAAELRAKSETKYDERGKVYQTITHNVEISGVIGNHLTSNTWYNARGAVIKTQDPNGLFKKTGYDGAGRATATYVSFDPAESTYAQAFDVAGDSVIEESVPAYDADGNVLYATRYQRTSSASVPSGDLASGWAVGNSRRTFTASWYDLGNRVTATANYGTNADLAFTRPSTAPAPNGSPNILVAKLEYDAGGRQYKMTNNLGKISQSTFDGLGRATRAIEDYVNGVAAETELDTDRITDIVYDSVGRMSQKIAYNPKGTGLGVASQTTQYVYATIANQASPAVYRNDVVAAVIYPDSDDTYTPANPAGSQLGNGTDAAYDRVEYTYDYSGRKSTMKDQRGNVHTYDYVDQQNMVGSGRLKSDTVTTLAAGTDGAVQMIYYDYDTLSRVQGVNSYADSGMLNLVNDMGVGFDGWGNAMRIVEHHTASAPTNYSYLGYAEGAVGGEAKYVRLAYMTYPNGRELDFIYPASGTWGDKLSRLDGISGDLGATLYAQYTYLGQSTPVRVTHPLVTGGLTLDYGIDTGSPAGWDRFGRVIDHKWGSTADPTKFDRFQHSYDNVSRRLTSDRTYTSAPTNRDEQYTYDNLHRLLNMKRGTLSGGTISNANSTLIHDWPALDAQGNWRSWRTSPGGKANPTYSTQARAHNKANEIDVNDNDADAAGASITQTGGSGMDWVDPQYEKSGSMKNGPKPGAETAAASRLHYTYDAWDRLVKVQADSSGAPGTTIAEYQYDGIHRRVVKLKPNGANWDRTDYYYNNGGQVVEERTATAMADKVTVATVPKYQWVWDPRYVDAPIFRDENKDGDGDCVDGTDERLYFVNDANFNTTALVTAAGTVVERYAYTPYGQATVFNASWTSQSATLYNNEILYAGYRLNAETQLYHVRARAYHPTLGRFLQRDPAGYHDSTNLYQYVRSAPYTAVDPSGQAQQSPGYIYLGIPPTPPKQPCKKQDKGLDDVPGGFRKQARQNGPMKPQGTDSGRDMGHPAPPRGMFALMMWIWDDSDPVIGMFVKSEVEFFGGAKGGAFDVGMHNLNSGHDVEYNLQDKMIWAADYMLTTLDNVCVSDYNIVTHRGGDSGTISFKNDLLFTFPNFRFLPSDSSTITGSPAGADTDELNYAGMRVLGRMLNKYACKNSCAIGVYSCTMGKSPGTMKDLATSSSCNVLGTTSVNVVGNGGWYMEDAEGQVVKMYVDGHSTRQPGPGGRAFATKSTMALFGE